MSLSHGGMTGSMVGCRERKSLHVRSLCNYRMRVRSLTVEDEDLLASSSLWSSQGDISLLSLDLLGKVSAVLPAEKELHFGCQPHLPLLHQTNTGDPGHCWPHPGSICPCWLSANIWAGQEQHLLWGSRTLGSRWKTERERKPGSVCDGASCLACCYSDRCTPAAGGQGAQRPTWRLSRKHLSGWS